MNTKKLLAISAVGMTLATGAVAQTARDVLGPTPWENVDNEPAPKLIVDPPLAEQLARGVAVIQYRTEHLRILPEVGTDALKVSPRIGHLHVTVDHLPWHWADANTSNTIVLAGLPAGKHSLTIELAGTDHHAYTSQTVDFVVPSLTN